MSNQTKQLNGYIKSLILRYIKPTFLNKITAQGKCIPLVYSLETYIPLVLSIFVNL